MDSRFDRRDPRRPTEGDAPTLECARIAPLLEAFYDGALKEDEARRVAGHLAGCAFCAARLRRYAELDALVRAAPAPVAGPELRVRLYRAIAAASGAGTDQDKAHTGTAVGTAVVTRERDADRDGDRSWSDRSFPGRSLPGGWRRAPARAPRGVWAGAAAALCVIVAFAVVFIAASRFGGGGPGASATATAAAGQARGILPAFHDWRAAYLDQFGGLHVVSLDGKTDTLVTTLAGLTVLNSQGTHAAVSPDGRYLAYVDYPKFGNIHLVDLAASTPAARAVRVISGNFGSLYWSPDSRWLLAIAVSSGVLPDGLYRVDPASGAMTPIQGYTAYAQPVAWLDATHWLLSGPPTGPSSSVAPSTTQTGGLLRTALAARASSASLAARMLTELRSSGPYAYYVVDVLAEVVKPATGPDVPKVPSGWNIWTFLPGTTDALAISMTNQCVVGCSGGPATYALLNDATGQITLTPKINSVAGGNIGYVAVDPVAGSGLFAAAPYVPQPSTTQLFLCDALHDGARPLATGVFPLDWTPDGQSVLLGDEGSLYNENGSGALSILNVNSTQTLPTVISQNMSRYLGLVRSA